MKNLWNTPIENVLDPFGFCRAYACACVMAFVLPLATYTVAEKAYRQRRRKKNCDAAPI